MILNEECENFSLILEETKIALTKNDSAKLKELSDRTVHSSCIFQNPGSILTAVIVYTLSKIIERKDYQNIKNWNIILKKLNLDFDLAIKSLKDKNLEAHEKSLEKARKTLMNVSRNNKKYIEEILRKAFINKGSKIYEHGISLGRTAELLGITQWELAEYSGQKNSQDNSYETISVKERAKNAMEFFNE